MVHEYESLDKALQKICGEGCFPAGKSPVFGGDINEAFRLTMNDGTVLFMKSNSIRSYDNFKAEAEGLSAIRETGAIGVPPVLGLGKDGDRSFLLLDYVFGESREKDYWETFAGELADMHITGTSGNKLYGFARNNYIGSNIQVNDWHSSWVSFFRECRLQPQLDMASSYFSSADRKRIDHLLSHLDSYLTEPGRPSLLHGDLWSGNMITGNDGKGWLIDPAVYYGHPEADIAMTELFGGFSYRFYGAYRETGLIEHGYEDRRDLYNLYHLLNHLNLFGVGYLSSVIRILKYYA